MKQGLILLGLISMVVISGCSDTIILDSKITCEDGRVVSISQGCRVDDTLFDMVIGPCNEGFDYPCQDEEGNIIERPEEGEFTSEFVDREFLIRYTSDGGFGGNGLKVEILGDGSFEITSTLFIIDEETKKTKKGRLTKEEMDRLVGAIEGNHFFNLPKSMKVEGCYDAAATSLLISLDENYHSVAEYCSFADENEDVKRYRNIVSLIREVTET